MVTTVRFDHNVGAQKFVTFKSFSSPVQDKRRKRILNDVETALIEDFIKKHIAKKVRPTFECVISSPACLPACMPACCCNVQRKKTRSEEDDEDIPMDI